MEEKNARQRLGPSSEEIDLLAEYCKEKLHQIHDDLIDAVDGRAPMTPEFVNRVFHGFGGVRAAATYLENDPLKELSQIAEDVLGAIAEGRAELSIENAAALLSALDRLKQMAVESNPFVEVDFSREAEDLNLILTTHPHPLSQTPPRQDKFASHSTGHPIASAQAGANLSRPLKILLVEDDFTSRVLLQGLLRNYGHCHVAVNGNEAVEAFRVAFPSSQGYDLICMDVRMPEMDGTEAVEKIRAIEEAQGVYSPSGVKIFMTTAMSDLKTIGNSYRALCDAYLIKPIDGAQLEEQLLAFGLIQVPVQCSTARSG